MGRCGAKANKTLGRKGQPAQHHGACVAERVDYSALPAKGAVAERFKAHAWKACWGQPLEGSNPSRSATLRPSGFVWLTPAGAINPGLANVPTTAADFFSDDQDQDATPIRFVTKDGLAAFDGAVAAWAAANGFEAAKDALLAVPGEDGALAEVLVGLGEAEAPPEDWRAYAAIAARVPAGRYRLPDDLPAPDAATLGWALGQYAFDRYKAREAEPRVLTEPGLSDAAASAVDATMLVRDLVNTPAADMGPEALEAAARELAKEFDAAITVTTGDALLEQNFATIHAVGRAAHEPPRLIDVTWGDADAPRVTLVGKGVCFDTGGLDLKTAAGMRLMKKDMGGAAHVLGLARMVMAAALPVRLRVLIPAVENAVSAGAFRPGDIITTRKGLTVEIGNTDAEGRLVLCDALALADEEAPDLILDFATLTGAARVALGPDLPALFTADDALAEELAAAGAALYDPVWRMPLWAPYHDLLKSPVADLNNISDGPFAGAITAALYLTRFVVEAGAYAHLDIFAWNPEAKPGRPKGGEACAMRAAFSVLAARYGGG